MVRYMAKGRETFGICELSMDMVVAYNQYWTFVYFYWDMFELLTGYI